MTVEDWLQSAIADAERRGLPELKPLLEAIAKSTAALREADSGGSRRQHGTAMRIADARAAHRARVKSRRSTSSASCLAADRRALGAERIHHRAGRSALCGAQKRPSRRSQRGDYRGPLHGIPVSIKDLVHVAGVPTTSGSAVPPIASRPHDAPVVRRLREAGAIIIGKTNLHEFAFGTTSEESAFGPVQNPFDPSRSAGGSSGGAAVALVEGMCLGSIGTDTGGSIRIPAAACGIVGLKPTLGELPCEGVVPLSTTCDHVGPMTLSVKTRAIMFDVAARHGRRRSDAPTSRLAVSAFRQGYLLERLDPEVRERVRSRVQAALKISGPSPRGRRHRPRARRRRTSTSTSSCRKRPRITRRCSNGTRRATRRA